VALGGRGSPYPGQVNFHYIERKSRRTETQNPCDLIQIAGVLPNAEPVGFEPTVPLLEDFTLAG
jgi:hypothetical protein